MVKIEVVRLMKLESKGSLKALVDIAIADSFLVKGLRIVEGRKGLFVAMPREQNKNGNWYDTIYPLSAEVKITLDETILEAYQK